VDRGYKKRLAHMEEIVGVARSIPSGWPWVPPLKGMMVGNIGVAILLDCLRWGDVVQQAIGAGDSAVATGWLVKEGSNGCLWWFFVVSTRSVVGCVDGNHDGDWLVVVYGRKYAVFLACSVEDDDCRQ
jgi:hypothetical protein